MKSLLTILFTFFISSSAFGQQTSTLNLRKFDKSIQQKEVIIIDVRTPEEFSKSHISNALNMDWNNGEEFEKAAFLLPRNAKIYLYCRSGSRSKKAMAWFNKNGFHKIRELKGGFEAWKISGKEILIGNGKPEKMDY